MHRLLVDRPVSRPLLSHPVPLMAEWMKKQRETVRIEEEKYGLIVVLYYSQLP